MLVDARGGDVLEMIVPRVRGHPRDPILRIFADAIGMADVEIQADPGRIDPLDELQVLAEPLDQQSRLGLDQQLHPALLGHFDAGHQLVVKQRRPPLATSGRAAAARPARS